MARGLSGQPYRSHQTESSVQWEKRMPLRVKILTALMLVGAAGSLKLVSGPPAQNWVRFFVYLVVVLPLTLPLKNWVRFVCRSLGWHDGTLQNFSVRIRMAGE